MYLWGYSEIYKNHIINDSLGVASAGTNTVNIQKSEIIRPDGLPDYQLIYVKKGILHAFKNNRELHVTANHGIIFKPNEPQHYIDSSNDKTHTCWIHFGGTAATALLEELDLLTEVIFTVRDDATVTKLFYSIISELQQKRPHHNRKTTAELVNLLIEIKRGASEEDTKPRNAVIERIKEQMQRQYNLHISNDEYAEECNLSLAYFIRSFKKQTGMSPQSYITHLRIEAAKGMLQSTNATVSEIALSVGYDDPLYFSRCFSKAENISPTEYRTRTLAEIASKLQP